MVIETGFEGAAKCAFDETVLPDHNREESAQLSVYRPVRARCRREAGQASGEPFHVGQAKGSTQPIL